jgi:arginine:ornithine antiporter/lysine permease
MYAAVFVFLGIESASTYSRYARRREDVGRATFAGFLLVLALVVSITVFSFGVLPHAELAGLRNPSTAYVLRSIVGDWGAYFISIALIVSVLGAYLSWTLIASEVLFVASRTGSMPGFLGKQNERGAPAAALWLTNGLVQVFLIVTFFAESAYLKVLDLTSAMAIVPYLLVAAYACRLAWSGDTYEGAPGTRARELVVAGMAVVFSLLLLYIGGVRYLLLSAIIYAPGIVLFAIARRERGEPVLRGAEIVVCGVITLAAVAAVYELATGALIGG